MIIDLNKIEVVSYFNAQNSGINSAFAFLSHKLEQDIKVMIGKLIKVNKISIDYLASNS